MPFIELKDLGKTYYDEEVEMPALSGVNLTVEKGEFIAVMGPSGSGKSTLLHILGFLDRQTHGHYYFDGQTMDDFNEEQIARIRNKKIGFIFQAFNLLPKMTVLENVKLPLLYSKMKEPLWNEFAERAIESVNLSHRAGYTASKLSGGERQRAAIARALVNDPDIIFADEPTGNLDSKSGETVMQIIKKLNEEEKRTIFLITHEEEMARYAHRIIKLKDGRIEYDSKK